MGWTNRLAAAGASALLASAIWAVPASASDAAVEHCRVWENEEVLQDAGWTFGECVTVLTGFYNEKAKSAIAGFCGDDDVLRDTGAANKGQCIKILRDTFF
jgi:hypothetical protein